MNHSSSKLSSDNLLPNHVVTKEKIALPTHLGFVFAPIENIVRCESDNSYTTFYFINRTALVVSKSISKCEKSLRDFNFFRVHRSHLINTRFLKEYLRGKTSKIKMDDDKVIDIAKERKQPFLLLIRSFEI